MMAALLITRQMPWVCATLALVLQLGQQEPGDVERIEHLVKAGEFLKKDGSADRQKLALAMERLVDNRRLSLQTEREREAIRDCVSVLAQSEESGHEHLNALSFRALSALWYFGEDVKYFESLAHDLSKPKLAHDAIWMLARTPSREQLDMLQQFGMSAGNLQIMPAIREYKRCWEAREQYEKLATVEEKFLFLAVSARSAVEAHMVSPYTNGITSLVAWAQAELSDLAREYPKDVPRLLKAITLAELELSVSDEQLVAFRSLLAKSLEGESLATWERIKEGR